MKIDRIWRAVTLSVAHREILEEHGFRILNTPSDVIHLRGRYTLAVWFDDRTMMYSCGTKPLIGEEELRQLLLLSNNQPAQAALFYSWYPEVKEELLKDLHNFYQDGGACEG